MAASFPYTHFACPCSDLTASPVPPSSKRASIQPTTLQLDQDRTFNPHDPRANYALYPLNQLLYCDECDAIHCPRCWTEEVLYWYCPSCLFEVPSSVVRGDGNRCSRSCYNCPSCTSPLTIAAVQPKSGSSLKPSDGAGGNESFIMQCQFCEWSSLDIDIQFNKATKITEQLAKLRKARLSPSESQDLPIADSPSALDHNDAFTNLTAFYKEQLSESGDPQNPYANSPYSSPANLARIMSLYGGLSYNALKKTREKPQPMREAMVQGEGLSTFTSSSTATEHEVIKKMEKLGWHGMASAEQRATLPVNTSARFADQLWPIATPLRTRRGKRCRTCRQFLARPEPKVSSMRYRIRLPALNFIPRLSVRTLSPATSSAPGNPSFPLRADVVAAQPPPLRALEPKQYVLTIRNPIEETVKISLATPATTPGKVASRVTILCPSFTVGPAGDVWDEALSAAQPSAGAAASSSDGSRQAAMALLTGGAAESDRQPEAGKIWERTRNSTAVILEIVPGSRARVSLGTPADLESEGTERDRVVVSEEDDEDDAVLEVPICVRAEWEAEVREGELAVGKKASDRQVGEKVRKELEYWVVLGIGRIES